MLTPFSIQQRLFLNEQLYGIRFEGAWNRREKFQVATDRPIHFTGLKINNVSLRWALAGARRVENSISIHRSHTNLFILLFLNEWLSLWHFRIETKPNQFHFAAWESCRHFSGASHNVQSVVSASCENVNTPTKICHCAENTCTKERIKKKKNTESLSLCWAHFSIYIFAGKWLKSGTVSHSSCMCLCACAPACMCALFTSEFRSDVTTRQSNHCIPRLNRVVRFVVYVRLITCKLLFFYFWTVHMACRSIRFLITFNSFESWFVTLSNGACNIKMCWFVPYLVATNNICCSFVINPLINTVCNAVESLLLNL